MNRYGRLAREHWMTHAPSRTAALPDPEEFFTGLGVLVQGQVSDLTWRLAGPDPAGETYLQKVARLATARRQAEEIVMRQLVWATDPELPLDQAREEWEQTRPSDENLILWADRMQDSPYPVMSTDEIEQMAADWALPVEFLHGMLEADSPRAYVEQHRPTVEEAATLRFLHEVR